MVNAATSTRQDGNSLSQPNGAVLRSTPSVARPAGTVTQSLAGDRPVADRHVACRPLLLIERQPVPHVQQSLLMHRLVLEDGEDRFGAIEQRVTGHIEVGIRQRVEHAPVRFVGEAGDLLAARPEGLD